MMHSSIKNNAMFFIAVWILRIGSFVSPQTDTAVNKISDNLAPAYRAELKMSGDPIYVDYADPLNAVSWPLNYEATAVYCVASRDAKIRKLAFRCDGGCSAEQNVQLAKWSSDHLISKLRFPVLKLSGVRVTDWKIWHNKLLSCVAFHDNDNNTPSSQRNLTSNQGESVISIPILVEFFDTPQVKTAGGHKPILNQRGLNTIYRFGNEKLELICAIDSYPPAINFSWLDGTANLIREKQRTLDVTALLDLDDSDFVEEKSFSCQANSVMDGRAYTSSPVFIKKAVKPIHVADNFYTIRNKFQPNVMVGQQVELQCTYSGYPEPVVKWFFEDSRSKIDQLNCGQVSAAASISSSHHDHDHQDSTPNTQRDKTSSACHLSLTSFNQTGSYWCTGCINIAENSERCDYDENNVPAHAIFLNITGRPIRSLRSTRIENVPDFSGVRLREPFCSNPEMSLSSISLTCDTERYFMLDHRKQIHFERIDSLPDTPFCYEASFVFYNPSNMKQSTFCTFSVENNHGLLEYNIPIGSYIASNRTDILPSEILDSDSDSKSENGFLFIFISLGLCVATVVLVAGYLWTKKRACFSGRKHGSATSDSLSKNGSTGANSHEEDHLAEPHEKSSSDNASEKTDKILPPPNEQQQNNSMQKKYNGKDGYRFVSSEIVV